MLAAARGRDNARIAADLRITADTVRKWRGRFAARGLAGLADLPRRAAAADQRAGPGRGGRAGLPAARRDRGAAVALDRPGTARRARRPGGWPVPMSASSVLRILAEHPVKPWQYQSWISPRDPDFEAKATVIVDLYQGCYQGEPLGPGDRILSVDAKPQINARGRLPPTARRARHARPLRARIHAPRLPRAAGRPRRAHREGVRLHPGHHRHQAVHGPRRPGHGRPEYKDAPRVFVIVDNGSDHRGQAAVSRLPRAHPNAIMIHTPVHASWLNQIVRHEVACDEWHSSKGDWLMSMA